MSEHPDPFGPQSARFGLSGVAAAAYLEHPVLGPRLGEAIRVVMANGSVSAASVWANPTR